MTTDHHLTRLILAFALLLQALASTAGSLSTENDAQIITEASDAISLLSCDPMTVDKIRAAAHFSPVIGQYADLRANRKPDPRDSLKAASLQACINAAMEYTPDSPMTLARALYNLACHQGSLYDKISLQTIDQAIATIKKAAKTSPDAAEEQLLLYETTRLYLLRNNFEGDNPMRFAELLELEKRVLKFYSTYPETLDKADIYHCFAMMKGYTEYQEDFDLASKKHFLNEPDAVKAAPYELDTRNGLYSNSSYYIRTSLEIFRRLRGDGSIDNIIPFVNSLATQIGLGQDSRLVATIDSIITVLDAYFPEENINMAEIRYIRDRIAAQAGYPLRFAWKYPDIAKAYRDYYGKENVMYVDVLLQLCINMSIAAGANPLPKEFYDYEEEYTTKGKAAYADDLGQYINDQLFFLQAYEQHDSGMFTAKLQTLSTLLNDAIHQPSWKLIGAMSYVVSFTYNNGRYDEALEMSNKVTECLERLTDGRIIPSMANRSQLTAYILEGKHAQPDSVKRAYEKAIGQCVETGIPTTNPLFEYSRYLYDIEEYEAAKKEARTLLEQEELTENPVYKAYYKTFLGNIMINSNDPDKKTIRRLFSEAIPVLTANDEAINDETVTGYLYIYYYYKHIGQLEKALQTLERGFSLVEKVCNPLYITWTTFNNEIFDTYFSLGRDADAERFNERQIAKLDSMGLNTSTTYLELLWNRYVIASWRTPNTPLNKFSSYMQQIPAFYAVYERSGQSKQILYDYGLRILNGIVLLMARYSYLFNISIDDVPEEYRDGIADAQQQLKQYEEYLIPTMLEIENDFPEYSKPYDYRSHSDYISLVNALYSWYKYIRPNKERAEHYLKLIVDLDNYNDVPWEGDDRLATHYIEEKDFVKAYEHSSKCYAQLDRFNNFEQIQLTDRQSWLARMLGHDDEAMAVSLGYAKMIRQYVLGNFDYISSSERADFINHYGLSGFRINDMLPRRPDELATAAYDAALLDKGLLLHSWERVRRSIMRSGDTGLIAQLDTLDRLNNQRNALDINAGDQETRSNYLALQNDIDRLEKRVAAATAKWRTDTMRVASWRDVEARLAEGEAAIEFVMADSALAALVVRPGYDRPHYVRLCQASECTDLLHATDSLPAETRARRLYTYGRSRLYDLVWQPVERELQGASTVYYSPTSFLHRIAFAALPISADSCLTDRYDLRYVTTTAQLLRPAARRKAKTATVFGGISYSPGQAEAAMTGGDGNRAAIKEEFGYLAETKTEADTITRDMEQTGIDAMKYMGERGTEPNFYSLDGNSTDIIHIATHGFYIPDDKVNSNPFLANHPGSKHSPMQRTGLAFAGANATWTGASRPDREDGILTANELSLLDLGQTDLVVLSACETALGDYSLEGVYGLQRGFKEAGARTLVLSLWNVNDQTTASFMQDFYRHWLGGKSKREAFTKAVATLRATHPNPFFWAAYVMLDGEE